MMKKENKKTEMPFAPMLQPEFRISTDFHFHPAFLNEEAYAGDSIGEHTVLEEVNEYLAEGEIKQLFDNS
ncbi:hypothetical protein [Parageobacillus thermoglucosidasius]|uniref:Uncharacterized protein n=1 Tax=Parageobacillus thermoglucosidasius TaxID=1426 RepID=A0AB38R3H7_PARTM|nr:hypothetical protein [Parageobacillus thermoglucosidasius]KYD15598.1 hypothetical protein B4168_3058 [Anoxybacillus flavithermus]EID43633.1 hypothetical protein GT20_2766 [Parageobacillus thermoglucosidasius TNO-09.020]OAO86346.1 hypothetical protein GT23_2239 [Parageobacillus thermoglucosidasius]UOE77020.1 hypothetical protein IMI45_03935 [Parageobacillus thermoglucosidasius]GCD83856.1 hypothetical protein PTHTG4_29210 [Parageobacillus thermoglucosidasius]